MNHWKRNAALLGRTGTLVAVAVSLLSMAVWAAPVTRGVMHMRGHSGTVRGKAGTASDAGSNPNIKVGPHKNDKSAPKRPAPASKGGKASARGQGALHFNNHTGLYVDCYIDRGYVGTVAPYGDLYYDDTSYGATQMYAQATFTDGSSLSWGPIVVDGSYTLNLSR